MTSNYASLDSRAEMVVREMPEELIARIVRIMIEKYDLDINTPLHDSRHTPLNFIIHLGNRTKLKFLVALLINVGARLNVEDQLGHNALVACLWATSKSGKEDERRRAYHDIIPLLIKASSHQNIDMDAEYIWIGKRRTLFKILRHYFSEWQPAKGLPNRVLWGNLYASTFNEDDYTTAAYFFLEMMQVSSP
ncbi:hypothetical protein N0V85_002153 [Neurospora sp. IMI 360204]|nr:hypothetical protein N0V85_002153 [Neurospora sp. IMI 360204]